MTTFYKSGEWNVTCDVCSRKIKSSNARKRWDGFIVCDGCYEERHPQDFVRARIDKISVPFQRPIPPECFLYLHNLFDTIIIDDTVAHTDYLINNKDYFLEDYILEYQSFSITSSYDRVILDSMDTIEDALGKELETIMSADSTDISDDFNRMLPSSLSFNDSVVSTESSSRSVTYTRNDSTSISDSPTKIVGFNPTISDTVSTITDTTNRTVGMTKEDSLTIGDTFSIVQQQVEVMTDTVNATDSGGSIYHFNYIDATYFQDYTYVGSIYTF